MQIWGLVICSGLRLFSILLINVSLDATFYSEFLIQDLWGDLYLLMVMNSIDLIDLRFFTYTLIVNIGSLIFIYFTTTRKFNSLSYFKSIEL